MEKLLTKHQLNFLSKGIPRPDNRKQKEQENILCPLVPFKKTSHSTAVFTSLIFFHTVSCVGSPVTTCLWEVDWRVKQNH